MLLTPIERENPDLSKPFSLYSSRVSLTLHERLNVLERETVKALLTKTRRGDDQISVLRSQEEGSIKLI